MRRIPPPPLSCTAPVAITSPPPPTGAETPNQTASPRSTQEAEPHGLHSPTAGSSVQGRRSARHCLPRCAAAPFDVRESQTALQIPLSEMSGTYQS